MTSDEQLDLLRNVNPHCAKLSFIPGKDFSLLKEAILLGFEVQTEETLNEKRLFFDECRESNSFFRNEKLRGSFYRIEGFILPYKKGSGSGKEEKNSHFSSRGYSPGAGDPLFMGYGKGTPRDLFFFLPSEGCFRLC